MTDFVVVGAGLMGAAAAWAASRAGLSVEVIEQFDAGHEFGSSHGHARIVRRAYADPFYVALTGQAFVHWAELERITGERLISWFGGLDHGSTRGVAGVADALQQHDVAHRVWSAQYAGRRWPGLRFDGEVVTHEQAGIVDPDAAVRAMLRASRATVRRARVLAVESDGRVVTDSGQLRGERVVVAAGAWTADLIDGLPRLVVSRQQYLEFRPHTGLADWPSVIHETPTGAFYHLAADATGHARKVGLHDHTAPGADPLGSRVEDPAVRHRIVEYVRSWLPGLDPEPSGSSTCLYTSTASEDFLLERSGAISVVSACSGHGAKFAPLIGHLAVHDEQVPARFRAATHRARPPGRPVSL